MAIQEIVAHNLRRIRVAHRISQEDLALIANVERAYVGHLERATRNPTILTLEKLASALDCEVQEFFHPIDIKADPVRNLRRGKKKS